MATRKANRFSLCTEDDDIILISQKRDVFDKAFTVLNEMRRSGELCDIVLESAGRKLSAHKIVLSAVIPYFRVMFTTDMMEATQKVISIHELDGDTLEQLVCFAYTGELKISAGNVQSIMIGANFLQLDAVVEECSSFLMARLSASNVLAVRSFCCSLGCQCIKALSENFIRKHFISICRSEDFLQLPLNEAVSILSDDCIYVESEEDVFNAVIFWIQHDPRRQEHSAKMLSCVRLHLLKPSFLADEVSSHHLVKSNLACRDLVDEAKDYHLIPERRALLRSFRLKPRCCSLVPGLIFAIGGLTPCGNASAVEMFDPMTRKWSSVRPMPSLRSRVGVSVHERKIYAIGGFDGIHRLSLVEAYDYNLNEWISCAPLQKERSALGAAFLHGRLYVCGGYDGITSLSTVEVYNPDTNQWNWGPAMSKQRSAAGVTVLDGYLYVIGGHDGRCIFNSVERFCPETGVWETVPPMISKRCRVGATTLNGKIYVCGGYDGSQFLSSVECFDPETMSWSPVIPMQKKRSRVSLVVNADTLYAIAGYDGISNLSSMELFNEESQEWRLGPSMISHEGGVGVAVVPIPPTLL